LLFEDDDIVTDEQRPKYCGHVVAVMERMPGQLFSGTLHFLDLLLQQPKKEKLLKRPVAKQKSELLALNQKSKNQEVIRKMKKMSVQKSFGLNRPINAYL